MSASTLEWSHDEIEAIACYLWRSSDPNDRTAAKMLRAMKNDIAELRHDLERAMANHNADLNP